MERLIPVLDKVVIATLFVFVACSMFSISITQISAGIGGLAWLWRTQLTGSWKDQRWPLWIPFLLFILACLIAVADAYDISYSYSSLKKLLEFLIFFWVLNCVRENRLRDSLSLVLIVSATLAGLFGFYQAWMNGVSTYARVEGTMSVYTTFAGLLMIMGLITLARAMFKNPKEIFLLVPIVVISICLLFTLTRQAWFGFLIGLAFLLFAWRKNLFLIFSVSIIVLVLVFPNQMDNGIQNSVSKHPNLNSFTWNLKHRLQTMVTGNDPTFHMRLALWRGGWKIFKDDPLTGCGFRCVDLVHTQHPDETGHIGRIRGMHNNFIQLAVDTGIFGLSAWLWIWFCFYRLLYRQAKDPQSDPKELWITFGSAAAVISFLVGGVFESNLYDSEVVMVLYLIMALPFAGLQNKVCQKAGVSPN